MPQKSPAVVFVDQPFKERPTNKKNDNCPRHNAGAITEYKFLYHENSSKKINGGGRMQNSTYSPPSVVNFILARPITTAIVANITIMATIPKMAFGAIYPPSCPRLLTRGCMPGLALPAGFAFSSLKRLHNPPDKSGS